jgi:hypothetical protein
MLFRASIALATLALPRLVEACAVCWSDPESPQTRGATMGILLLLGVTGGVLASFAAFFICLWRRGLRCRADAAAAASAVSSPPATTPPLAEDL